MARRTFKLTARLKCGDEMRGRLTRLPVSSGALLCSGLFALLGIPYEKGSANLWLWRRLPHPDTLVPGGPEVDFGIQTDHVFLLGEAKWRSSVGAAQGVHRDKDQLTLRREFCEKYGQRMLPRCSHFVVLGVSWNGRIVTPADTVAGGIILYVRDTTWHAIVNLPSHPCAEEL